MDRSEALFGCHRKVCVGPFKSALQKYATVFMIHCNYPEGVTGSTRMQFRAGIPRLLSSSIERFDAISGVIEKSARLGGQ